MGCTFCASTLEGCVRNPLADEMLGQMLVRAQAESDVGTPQRCVNGSGEPLDNYDQTVRFLRLATHPEGAQHKRYSLLSTRLVDQSAPAYLQSSSPRAAERACRTRPR